LRSCRKNRNCAVVAREVIPNSADKSPEILKIVRAGREVSEERADGVRQT
jgi:hypothetical protein